MLRRERASERRHGQPPPVPDKAIDNSALVAENNGRPKRSGNLSAKTIARLERRSELFAQMTQGKGKPMTFGSKAKPEKP